MSTSCESASTGGSASNGSVSNGSVSGGTAAGEAADNPSLLSLHYGRDLLTIFVIIWAGAAAACTVRKFGFGYAAWEYSLISPLRTRRRRTRMAPGAQIRDGRWGPVMSWRELFTTLMWPVLVVVLVMTRVE
jgi:hypothetical protein